MGDEHLPEHDLIARARCGEPRALDLLLERHRPRLIAYCRQIGCSEDDAHDAAQEASLRAWYHFASFRGEAGFGTWLYVITVNVCSDLLHRRLREPGRRAAGPGPDEPADPEPPDPRSSIQWQVEAKLFLEALRGQLDGRDWQVLVLSEDAGQSSSYFFLHRAPVRDQRRPGAPDPGARPTAGRQVVARVGRRVTQRRHIRRLLRVS